MPQAKTVLARGMLREVATAGQPLTTALVRVRFGTADVGTFPFPTKKSMQADGALSWAGSPRW
jgi:hypothetical protein